MRCMKRKKFAGIANFSGVAEIGIYVAVYKSADCAMKMKRHVKRGTGGLTVNHDATHCLDYKKSCPNSCYRAQLMAELRKIVYLLPVSWAHFKGTKECIRGAKNER